MTKVFTPKTKPVFTKSLIAVAILVLLAFNFSFAQSSALNCNAYTPLITDQVPGLTTNKSNFSGDDKLINTSLTDYASWGYFIAGSGWVEVKDPNATGANVYPAGTYAGFVIDDNSINIIGGIDVTTYLGSQQQEEKSGSSLLLFSILSGKQRIGFTTTKNFDRIRISFSAWD